MLTSNLRQVSSDLLNLLARDALLEWAVDPDSTALADMAEDFALFAISTGGRYDQVCWIDSTGMERVRVDWSAAGPKVITADQLRNMADQLAFMETAWLEPNGIFISPPTLKTGTDAPARIPILQAGTPLLDHEGGRRGILLLSWSAQYLIHDFTEVTAEIHDHVAVFNSKGWRLMTGLSATIDPLLTKARPLSDCETCVPGIWQEIVRHKEGHLLGKNGLWTWSTVCAVKSRRHDSDLSSVNCNRWKVVSRIDQQKIAAIQLAIIKKTVHISLLLAVVLCFSAWKLAAAQGTVLQAKKELEAQVKERTVELKAKIAELKNEQAQSTAVIDALARIGLGLIIIDLSLIHI
mgnify:CR=1 FL=1